MMVLRLIGLVLALGCAALPARAQTTSASIADRYLAGCAGAASSFDAKECLGRQFHRVDEELNAVWPHVLRLIDSSDRMPVETRRQWKEALLKSQRAWIGYKEAECHGSAPFKYYGGAQAEIEQLDCLVRVTANRLGELKEYLEYRR
jgi:uncharacterized protein YecT (DUF1311 family)